MYRRCPFNNCCNPYDDGLACIFRGYGYPGYGYPGYGRGREFFYGGFPGYRVNRGLGYGGAPFFVNPFYPYF